MNQKRWGFHISHVYSLWQDLSVETIFFCPSGLDLDFDLLLEKLKLVAAGGISPVRTDPDLVCCVILWYTSSANASDSLINIFKILWKYMDQYHESQTAGKCIVTSSPAKHDMSQARLYRINDYDVEQNYEKSCLASVPQQYLIHKQHKHLDISDQPKSNAILNAILLYAMQY